MSEIRIVITAASLALAMLLAGVVGWRRRIGIVILSLLSLLSLVWLTVDRDWEGGVIAVVDARHGLTAAGLWARSLRR